MLAIDGSSPATVTGNPTTTTASFTPPDDAVLVIGWSGNSDLGVTPPTPTITDNLGVHLTYTLAGHSTRADTGAHPDGQAAMWTAQVGLSAAMTVTVTNNAATARHAALNVWVVTGAAVGTVGKGCNGFAATTVVQSYTATADDSQGFMAVCDWDTAGTETAGSGCTMDSSSSIAGQISYGFLQRTVADGSNGGLTTLTSDLPGSSASLNWVYAELTPLVGDPAEKDPPPFIMWYAPGEGLAPNGQWAPWLGTENEAPPATGLIIDQSGPDVALNLAGTATATTTASFTPPAGSLLLVMWSGNSQAGVNPSTPTITDSLGSPLTYTLSDWQSRADSPLTDGQAAIWTAPVVSAAPMTVTVNNNAASPTRHAALQVLVLTGEHATPVGAHGKAGSLSAVQIAQSYTATATGGQGFIVATDWTAHAFTAGMDCYLARPSSAGLIVGQITYGMFKRTIADDVASQSNRLNVQIAPTATELAWAYVEIVPSTGGAATVNAATVAAVADVAAVTVRADQTASPVTVAAVATVGAATVAAGSAPAPATVVAAATVAAVTVQAGTAPAPATVAATASVGTVTIPQNPAPATVAATASVGAPTVQTGSAVSAATVAAVAGVGAVTVRLSVAIAPATVAATATVAAPTVTTGSAVVAATVTAVAAVPAPTVRAGSAPSPSTVVATASVAAVSMSTGETVTAVTVAAVAAVPAPSLGGSASINPATVAATAAVGTVQLPATAAPATVAAAASVPSVTVQAGSAPAPSTVVATAAVPAVTVRLSVAIAPSTVTATAAVPSPVLHTGAAVLATTVAALAAVGSATVTSGVITPATVAAVASVGAATVVTPPQIGMDQGTSYASLLSGTAFPGPTLDGSGAKSISMDLARSTASSLG